MQVARDQILCRSLREGRERHVEALHYHELQNPPENCASTSGCSSADDDPVREPEDQGRWQLRADELGV